MTQVLIDRATLELVLRTLNRLRYDNDSVMAEEGFHEAAEALRAALANAEPTQSKPYAWRNPMNGVVISNDKKERLLCVGRGYPNFSEPLYVAGAKP